MRQAQTTVDPDDVTLVRQTREGQVQAFALLVTRYQDRIFNTCLRICGHREDARDLTQEAFLKAYQALDRFQTRSSFYTWIFRIAVNLSLTHRRKARLRYVEPLDRTRSDGQPERHETVDPSAASPAAVAEKGEALELVTQALPALDEHHRAMIVLRDIEGCDYRQIAEIMDVPVGTVKSRVFRAREALREALKITVNDSLV